MYIVMYCIHTSTLYSGNGLDGLVACTVEVDVGKTYTGWHNKCLVFLHFSVYMPLIYTFMLIASLMMNYL